METLSMHESQAPAPANPAAVEEAADAAVTVQTRLGPIPYVPARHVEFEGGLPGFAFARDFQLEPIGEAAGVLLLQSLQDPELGFMTVVLDPEAAGLSEDVIGEALAEMGAERADLLVLGMITTKRLGKMAETFVNLRAPVFVDVKRRKAAQVVLKDANLPLRHKLASKQVG